jgi:hypothetical protein
VNGKITVSMDLENSSNKENYILEISRMTRSKV